MTFSHVHAIVIKIFIVKRKMIVKYITTEHLILPKPIYALAPPKFLTRNNPDFLKLQFMANPKSDSRTQVHCILLIVPKEMKVKLHNNVKKL